MLSLNYNEIYSMFHTKAEAYDVIELLPNDANAFMCEWLKSVKANPRIRYLFDTFVLDEELMEMQFEIKHTQGDDESDRDFVRELMASGIAWKWSEPKYKSILHMRQMFGGKEEKFYSQQNHAAGVKEIYLTSRADVYRLICDYGYLHNDYIGD